MVSAVAEIAVILDGSVAAATSRGLNSPDSWLLPSTES